MAAGNVDDPSTAEEPSYAPRHLPRLEQLFARQATSQAHSASDTIEQVAVRKTTKVVTREPGPGGRRECVDQLVDPLYARSNSTEDFVRIGADRGRNLARVDPFVTLSADDHDFVAGIDRHV